jgi:hypothetical protein
MCLVIAAVGSWGCERGGNVATVGCGNGVCEDDEDETTCPEDCEGGTCGDGVCDADEDETSCPEDCEGGTCGDGVCDADEDEASCPEDCVTAVCGDGECNGDETPYSCPEDCDLLACGNGVCEGDEDSTSCPEDCSEAQCGNGVCDANENPATCPDDCAEHHKVDLLFVVDNSNTMQNEQLKLVDNFPALHQALADALDRVPDLHIGVVTTNLGSGGYDLFYCEGDGDGGVLGRAGGVNLGESCLGAGQRYMVDVEPEGCAIDRGRSGECVQDDCTQQQCDDMAQGGESLELVHDSQGCPRCRNFQGIPSEAFSCIASVGVQGCGFEQQLEAMRMALDTTEVPENQGFLRPDALLAIVFVTDEDDCSVSDPILFDDSESSIDSTLGFLSSFRCFEFGVTCDINDRTATGPRQDCEPRDDAGALLYTIDRYTTFLANLVDPGRLLVATLAGPVEEEVVVERDELDRPYVVPTCVDENDEGATPGIRLEAMLSHFNTPAELENWAYSFICRSNYQNTLHDLGIEIRDRLGQQ